MPTVTAGKVCSGCEELRALAPAVGMPFLLSEEGGPRRVGGSAPCFYFVLCF